MLSYTPCLMTDPHLFFGHCGDVSRRVLSKGPILVLERILKQLN